MMALSLGFHIVFASIGMAMPFFMTMAYRGYLKNGNVDDLRLTKMWAKGVAILFAIGAVSGTVLSFELGLLWPGFMEKAGSIFGMPFSWEGTAFFLEAIAIGIFLYGWNRLPARLHYYSGIAVGLCGFASGVLVLSANAWMNAPTGFVWNDGNPTDIDPVAAMFNDAWFHQSLHMQLAAFAATGFAVAGIHAYYVLRRTNLATNLRALNISLTFGSIAAILLPISGHYSAQWVAKHQPTKLAAMEALYDTTDYAPLLIGGIPNDDEQSVSLGIEIPGALSFLAFNNPAAPVQGLNEKPRSEWPPVLITHLSFQTMVGIGSLLFLLACVFWLFRIRQASFPRWFLKTILWCTPLGFVALEAGWIVTEVGRQPWIIYEIMKTADSVTDVPGIGVHLLVFTGIYIFLAFMCFYLLRRLIRLSNQGGLL